MNVEAAPEEVNQAPLGRKCCDNTPNRLLSAFDIEQPSSLSHRSLSSTFLAACHDELRSSSFLFECCHEPSRRVYGVYEGVRGG